MENIKGSYQYTETLKGIAKSSKSKIADEMIYIIDDSVLAGTNLQFRLNNQFFSKEPVPSHFFATNCSPWELPWRVPGSSVVDLAFEVDGTRVNAICTGEAVQKGSLYPTDTGDVIVYLPEGVSRDDITELMISIPANSVKMFYIDVVLPTGSAGSIPTRILFK